MFYKIIDGNIFSLEFVGKFVISNNLELVIDGVLEIDGLMVILVVLLGYFEGVLIV